MSAGRGAILACLLAATAAFTAARTTPSAEPVSLDRLPRAFAGWHGVDADGPDAATRRELRADAYMTRTYETAGAAPVGLYIAYYAQQRPTVSIHSPLHCLPGTGWEPLGVTTVALGGGSPATVRRMVVRKNLDRAIVLYWYAIHGRVVAGEIASKLWLLRDSLLDGRSDAALVRVTVPVQGSIDAADRDALAFARALQPHVSLRES